MRHPAGRACRPSVGRAPERQDVEEDEREEDQSERETDAVSEALRQVVHDDDVDHETQEGDQEQQEPPPRPADDLQENEGAVDRDQRGPARQPGFREDDPERDHRDRVEHHEPEEERPNRDAPRRLVGHLRQSHVPPLPSDRLMLAPAGRGLKHIRIETEKGNDRGPTCPGRGRSTSASLSAHGGNVTFFSPLSVP